MAKKKSFFKSMAAIFGGGKKKKTTAKKTAAAKTATKKNAAEAKKPTVYKESELKVKDEIHTKVVGVTFKNTNGSDRQEIIASLKVGDGLVVMPYKVEGHPEALGVFTEGGRMLGSLPEETARSIIEKYAYNPMKCEVSSLTGGTADKPTRGCNILITVYYAKGEEIDEDDEELFDDEDEESDD